MLQSIRDYSQGWIAKAIIFLVCFTFVIWGVHSYISAGGTSAIAKVNGTSISQGQLTAAYERLRQQQQLQLGADFIINHNIEKKLKQQALSQLITTEILTKAALAEGLRFTDQQLAALIQTVAAFQVNGHFSATRFHEVLSGLLYNEHNFLADMRSAMLINEVRVGITHSAFALPAEVDASIRLINQRRDISFLRIPAKQFLPKAQVTEAAIQKYYDQHQADFKTPEQVSISYLELSLPELKAELHLSEAESQQYYKDNLNNYTINQQAMPFAKVRSQVEQALLQQKAEQRFADATDKLTNLAYTNPTSLTVPAKALGLPIKSTGFFSHEDKKVDPITSNPKIINAAFSNELLASGNNSDLIELSPDRIIVLRIKDHKPVATLPLVAVKKVIEEQLKNDMARQEVKLTGVAIVNSLQQGTPAQQVAEKYHLSWEKRVNVGRYDVSTDAAILSEAFHIPKPATEKTPNISSVALPTGDYAVIALNAVHEGLAATQDIEIQRRVFREEIEHGLGQLDYERYVRGLFNHAKIDVEDHNP